MHPKKWKIATLLWPYSYPKLLMGRTWTLVAYQTNFHQQRFWDLSLVEGCRAHLVRRRSLPLDKNILLLAKSLHHHPRHLHHYHHRPPTVVQVMRVSSIRLTMLGSVAFITDYGASPNARFNFGSTAGCSFNLCNVLHRRENKILWF